MTSVETKTAAVTIQLLSLYGEVDDALINEIRSKLIPDDTTEGSLLEKMVLDDQCEEVA